MAKDYREFQVVESSKDIDMFLGCTNSLHDAYLIGVQYEHNGHSGENPHWINHKLSKLKLRFIITSINNAVVELIFSAISEWQIKDNTFEITDTAISFDKNGNVIWTDDNSTEPFVKERVSYVIAEKMKWHFV